MNATTTKAAILAVAAAAALCAATLARAQGEAAPRVLEIRDFAGRIEVDTSVGGPLRATVTPGSGGLGATIAARGVNLVVDGGLSDRSMRCDGEDGRQIRLRANGRTYSREELPVLRVTGGPGIGVRIVRSAVEGRIGPTGGATIGTVGCGRLAVGRVRQDAEISVAGSGDLELAGVGGDLELNIAGGGDSRIGPVGRQARLNIAGSGSVALDRAGAGLEISIAGSGDVTVAGGEGPVQVSIAGSGNVEHRGVAVDPSVSILGSGDVSLRAVRGERRFSSMGSGRIEVAN